MLHVKCCYFSEAIFGLGVTLSWTIRLLLDLNICLRHLKLPKPLPVTVLRNHNTVLNLVSRGLNSFIFLDVDELEPAQKKQREQLAYLQSEEFQKILNAKSKHTGILKEVWPPSSHDWGLRHRELIGLLMMISARSRYPNMPQVPRHPDE